MATELALVLRVWQKTTAYGNPSDWVFASRKTHGRTFRVGNMLVSDYLRPAAIKAGVVLKPGQRFGFHNLRHSLSSLLITGQKSDVRTTQDILRHSSSATTLNLYTAIADGTANRRARVGAQRDSETADPKSENWKSSAALTREVEKA